MTVPPGMGMALVPGSVTVVVASGAQSAVTTHVQVLASNVLAVRCAVWPATAATALIVVSYDAVGTVEMQNNVPIVTQYLLSWNSSPAAASVSALGWNITARSYSQSFTHTLSSVLSYSAPQWVLLNTSVPSTPGARLTIGELATFNVTLVVPERNQLNKQTNY